MADTLKTFRTAPVITLFAGALLLVFVSWYRAFTAGTLMVDGHGLQGWPELGAFVLILAALASFSLAYYSIWKNNNLSLLQVKQLAIALACVFILMLPMLSNDIFTYLVFGDAVNKGADVYTNTQSTHVSVFFPYITGLWTNSPCAYGPVVLLIARLAAGLAMGKIFTALVVYKLAMLLMGCLFIEVAFKIALIFKAPVRSFAFIVLNPAFLLQGIGQLHADLLAVTFILSAVYFMLVQKWPWVFIMIALSVATKMNYILVLPFFVMALAMQNSINAVTYRKTGAGLLIMLITLAAVYAPFFTSAATITTPFTFHFFQNPSKCLGEVLSYGIYFAPQILRGHVEQLSSTVTSPAGPYSQLLISITIVKICRLFALAASFYILLRFMLGERSLNQWFKVYVRSLLLFLLFYMHIFNPWYLMMILPFMWVKEQGVFMRWLFVLTCLISVQDIVCVISRNSVVYVAELALTFASIIIYLYKPHRMFFATLGYRWAQPKWVRW